MSIFNKQGVEFRHLVQVPPDPTVDPTYTHPFPVVVGNRVEERWSTKIRPIKDLTRILQGSQLKRNRDYMIDYTGQYDYWFLDQQWAIIFQLAVAGRQQMLNPKGPQLSVLCPHCAGTIPNNQITWV